MDVYGSGSGTSLLKISSKFQCICAFNRPSTIAWYTCQCNIYYRLLSFCIHGVHKTVTELQYSFEKNGQTTIVPVQIVRRVSYVSGIRTTERNSSSVGHTIIDLVQDCLLKLSCVLNCFAEECEKVFFAGEVMVKTFPNCTESRTSSLCPSVWDWRALWSYSAL